MPTLVLFNKPFNVLSQFTDSEGRKTLSDYIKLPNVYPTGRLDRDSEGLLLLTDDGQLAHQLTTPSKKTWKTYWVQVEGEIEKKALTILRKGLMLKDGVTLPARARSISAPAIWPRTPPVRYRAKIPTSWLELQIREGRNRQVRRMTAAVGLPTLRLVRIAVGPWRLDDLAPGAYRVVQVAPAARAKKHHANRNSGKRPRKR